MELIAELVNNQMTFYLPVAIVLLLAILVFTFGFKSAEQPPFDKLSAITSDDRKLTGKKRKTKERKTVNGIAVPVAESKAEKAAPKEPKRSPTKESPSTPKQIKKQEPNSPNQADKKKVEAQRPKKPETLEDSKNKKNLKGKIEKPVDFDDGNWETVPTKNDKKKKIDSPVKKDKKVKKFDIKEKEIEKLVKDEVDKQLSQEDDKENKASENIKKNVKAAKKIEEIVPVIEEKKVKKEKKPKKEKEEVAVDSRPIPNKTVSAPVSTEESSVVTKQEAAKTTEAVSGVAFDELGDMWTEAKAIKKTKKKSRRDN